MTASSFPLIEVRFFDNDGRPAAGFLLEQFQSGTTIDEDTFTDYAGSVPNQHPITLDEFGRCQMFGTPATAYTFQLIDPVTLEVEWTRDNILPASIASGGSFVPLDGSVAMTGLLELVGPGTSALNPPTLQQMTDAIAASLASMVTLVADATAAAAAATAAAAAVKPTYFDLADAAGAGATRNVDLIAGTWQVSLVTEYSYNEGVGGNYTITPTQSATVGATTVNTTSTITRAGGSGYGRNIYGRSMGVGTFVQAAAATVAMTMAAAVLGAATSRGSRLTLSKIA